MELKSLYNAWEVPTDEGEALYREVSALLGPVMRRMREGGYRLREAAHIMHGVIAEHEAYECLSRNMDAHKQGDRP